MTPKEVSVIVKALAAVVKEKIDIAIGVITGRADKMAGDLEQLSEKVAGIPAGPRGEKGDQGQRGEQGVPGDAGPVGPAGERGLTGETGAPGEKGQTGLSIEGPKGEAGERGEKGDRGDPGATGEKGDRGDTGAMGDSIKGDPGERGTDGKDGQPGPEGPRGEQGPPGIAGMVGEKGIDGKDGRDGIAKDGKDGRDGRDGVPGRDALAIEILSAIDPSKIYSRGIFARHAGGLVRSTRSTDPLLDDLEKAGWEVIVEGVSEILVQQGTDERSFEVTIRLTSGSLPFKTFSMPVLIYREIYKEGAEYSRGDVVTFGGNAWHCQRDTKAKPGTNAGPSSDWKLMVREGREGKAGKEGPQGPAGKDGRNGKDITPFGLGGNPQ